MFYPLTMALRLHLRKLIMLCMACAFLGMICACPATELRDLKVLYVGNNPRAKDFQSFLAPKVARIELANRANFNPATVAAFDVVILDWPQSENQDIRKALTSPFGKRESWNKPTVLLGSAGLHIAMVWDVHGGAG